MSLPDRFGRYQVLDVLGQGAMGLVYKAVDPVIERAVAVKVVQSGPGLSEPEIEQMRARFEQEFRSAGALSHANIVTVFDVGKEGDLYYIAMEYVEGRSLDRILAERRVLPLAEVGAMACELADALDYAHSQGVVHRDIKPANVLIDAEGRAKITDFGLAKLEATTLTRTGALVGTPAYMSPEQIGGHTISGKTDQFSLAIMLYQMLTGERPFTGDSPSMIMYRIAHEEPLPARQLNKSLPAAVDDVLLRALQKDSGARFPSCTDLAEGLRRALAGEATIPEAASPRTTPPDSAPAAAHAQATLAPPASPSTQSKGPPATPRWLLTLGIVLPSGVLLVLVAWFISGGIGLRGSAPPTGPADNLQAGGATESSAGAADSVAGQTDPEAAAERPASIRYSVTSDPEGASVTVDGGSASLTTPAEVDLSTEADHYIEVAARGFEPYRWQVRMAGIDPEGLPTNMHVVLSRVVDAPGSAGNPTGRAGRIGDRIEALEGIPPQLQQLMDSGQIRSGRLVIESPFAVGLRLVPASRLQNMSAQLRERLQNASAEERRRLMAGFFVAQSGSHDIRLPAGNWRLAMIAPQVFFYHEEQIVLRPEQTLRLDERVPSRLVRVRITSDPAGARVREGNMPAVPTPFDGLIVAGDHRFEFIWDDTHAIVPATIDQDGQRVVGRRQP